MCKDLQSRGLPSSRKTSVHRGLSFFGSWGVISGEFVMNFRVDVWCRLCAPVDGKNRGQYGGEISFVREIGGEIFTD